MRGLTLLLTVAAGCGRFGFGDAPPDGTPLTDPDACVIAIDASAPRINFNTVRTITTTGGLEPVAFSIDNPSIATIGGATGQLAASSQPGTVTITATDAGGCSAEASLVVGGDVLWYAGGSISSVPTNQVLRSTDGLDWTAVGTLPGARSTGALVVLKDRLWWVAGSDGSPRNEVFVSDDGVTWTGWATDAPVAVSSFAYTVLDGYFYIVGGNGNAGAVFRTKDMETWEPIGDLPDDNHGGALAAVAGQLIYAGGHNSTVGLFDWVLASPNGAVWTPVGTLPVPREYAGVTVVNNRMYVIGGQNTTPTAQTAVTSTTDGVAWVTEPGLVAGRAFGAVLHVDGVLWCMGGSDMGGVWRGTPGGTWVNAPSQFMAPRQGGRAALFTPP